MSDYAEIERLWNDVAKGEDRRCDHEDVSIARDGGAIIVHCLDCGLYAVMDTTAARRLGWI